MVEHVFNLQWFLDEGSRCFAGREKGKKIRQALNLDSLEVSQAIAIIFPDCLYSVSEPFLSGLLGPSYKKLGPRFDKVYSFKGNQIFLDKIGEMKKTMDRCNLEKKTGIKISADTLAMLLIERAANINIFYTLEDKTVRCSCGNRLEMATKEAYDQVIGHAAYCDSCCSVYIKPIDEDVFAR